MMLLSNIVDLSSGSPRSRITESLSESAPEYYFFSQRDLEEGLTGIKLNKEVKGKFRTNDPVVTASDGNLIFSLISGKAAFAQPWHEGLLITQNYVKLLPNPELDSAFLAFLLNENSDIQRQFIVYQQGSETFKYTIRQLSGLQLPELPSLDRQKIIGSL